MSTYTLTPPETFEEYINFLDPKEFDIPRSQENSIADFPTYLESELDRYATYYTQYLKPHFDDALHFGTKNAILHKIQQLSAGINTAVKYYYKGKILQATEEFRNALNEVGFKRLTAIETIRAGRIFYRTRASSDRRLVKKDLFHNPFQNRGIVATSRYSIPGLPALYLGDSTYVCWEEFNQKSIKDLYFSLFRSEEDLKVVKIQRLDDFTTQLQSIVPDFHDRLTALMRYLSLFPLSIACSIRTKSNTDTFKPEYIIPQLLLQYVTAEKDVSGIMFPSTKVAYDKISGVAAYNYVFPVKQVQSKGYCSELMRIFSLTEPTSTELESLMNFSGALTMPKEEWQAHQDFPKVISIDQGEGRDYMTTAFGFLERVLQKRIPASLSSTHA